MSLSVLGTRTSRECAAASTEPGKHYERAVLAQVFPALRSNAATVSTTKRAALLGKLDYPLAFPRVDVQPPLKDATDVDLLRSSFRQAKEWGRGESWRNHSDSVRRCARCQRTRIFRLNLNPIEQLNPLAAIDAIVNSPDIRSLG